jgi:hypothetical protein
VKLANYSGQMPQDLFVDITEFDPLPVAKGGSAFIHFGRYVRQAVVIKRIIAGPDCTPEIWEQRVKASRHCDDIMILTNCWS